MMSEPTSLITILSSEHGRMRREQRDIAKRDLQRAKKYGRRQRCWGERWKIEYDGIIFITDNAMKREVTCYPSPLAMAPLSLDDHTKHRKAYEIIRHKKERCASHTVLVVDNSGSMTTHDINLHRDRQVAAYSTMALEYIAEQLFNGTANNSDVVSLVEFRHTANVVFSREPVTWVLYNKLLARRDRRNFKSRELDRSFDMFDSNYLPALKVAEELLATDDHEDCALALLFLSDGAPTDHHSLEVSRSAAKKSMVQKIQQIAYKFAPRLDVSLIGFGNDLSDFSLLEAMAMAVNIAPGDTRAKFIFCDKRADMLGKAVSNMVTLVSESRLSLSQGGFGKKKLTDRDVLSEKDTKVQNNWQFYLITGHFEYSPYHRKFVDCPGLPFGAIRPTKNKDEALAREQELPPYIAINTFYYGKGAERLAFRCRLSESRNVSDFAFSPFIAKESRSVERIEEKLNFHRKFCETQNLASYLAREFNRRLRGLPTFNPQSVPVISFLPCSVLVLRDKSSPDNKRVVLVEKFLDTNQLSWCKWNDNAGGIEGRPVHIPIDVNVEYRKLQLEVQGIIIEEGSEDDDDESADASSSNESDGDDDDSYELTRRSTVTPADYLQAFTHFTYRFTDRKLMVCDLQGIYDDTVVPPRFELTDPAIHYRSEIGREMVYGRTDKGQTGIDLFFRTHKCTKVCRFLQLSAKNNKWKTEWRKSNSGARPAI